MVARHRAGTAHAYLPVLRGEGTNDESGDGPLLRHRDVQGVARMPFRPADAILHHTRHPRGCECDSMPRILSSR